MSVTHELKVHPQFWPALKRAEKPFEIRKNDRKFHVGDLCVFKEWNPEFGYTESGTIAYPITYVLAHEDFPLGLQPGYVALGFGVLSQMDDCR